MSYIDGYVMPVPTANKDAYLAHARKCAKLFKRYGALRVVENWGVDIPEGEVTSFPKAVNLKPDETVMFSWIIWPSKQARDESMAEIEKDPFWAEEEMQFDGKRMIIGSFETVVDE